MREEVPAAIVVEVLEEAVKQSAAIRDFWPWAEGVLHKVCERERLALVEREHEGRKREFAESAGAILEQVMLRVEREKRGEHRGNP